MVDECHRLLFATGLLLLDKMQEMNSDAVIHRRRALAGIKCILTLPWTFGCTEYFCCWNNPALYAMQEYSPIWPNDLLILALSVICLM